MKRSQGLSLLAVSLSCIALSAYVPGENLHSQGIPNISDTLIDEVNRYTEFRTASLESWHPKKKEMLIRTRFADTQQVHLVRSPIGERKQLTFFKDTISAASYEPLNGDYFIFEKDSGGDENYQLHSYEFKSGALSLLTDGKSRNTGGVWSEKGDQIAFESNRRNKKDMDIYVMSPASKTTRMVAELEGGGFSASDWSKDDKQLLLTEEISINEGYLWLLDIAGGKKTLITPKKEGEQVAYNRARFSRDGKGIYLATDKDSEFCRLVYMELDGKISKILTPTLNWDVSSFSQSWDGKYIAYVSNEDGIDKLHIIQTADQKELALPELPKGQISDLSWHKNNDELGFSMETAQSPADAYSFSIASKKLTRWTESETGGINTANYAEPEIVHWKSFDGKMISGILYMPPKKFTGKRPVMMIVHGGPEGQSTAGFLGKLNYYLNELGIAIIFPNVRGSAGFGKSFLKADNGFNREGSYKDIDALFSWIKESPKLDADKVMVTGGSYGGFMTLAVASNYADKIKCALDIVGPSNLVTFLERTEGYRRDLRRVEYGDERDPKMREFLEKIAPRNHADKITKPLFVVQGKNDPRVPEKESEDMVNVIRNSGTPVWYLLADDEGHGFKKKKNSDYQFFATIMFVKKYLLGENG
ncbi:MAG: alpha/beta fold hydrolase [Candidatus Obscuribacterales bacterium]|nr:alpha/beta fold hydrolase [Candidatus Obscuribacterales bacterium]